MVDVLLENAHNQGAIGAHFVLLWRKLGSIYTDGKTCVRGNSLMLPLARTVGYEKKEYPGAGDENRREGAHQGKQYWSISVAHWRRL